MQECICQFVYVYFSVACLTIKPIHPGVARKLLLVKSLLHSYHVFHACYLLVLIGRKTVLIVQKGGENRGIAPSSWKRPVLYKHTYTYT